MEENTKEKAKNPIKKYLIMILFGVIAIAGCSIYLSVSKEKHNFTEFKDNHDGTETRICTECAYSETRNKRLMLNAFDEVVYPYTYISELAVFGTVIKEEPKTEFNPQNPKITYTFSLQKKEGATGAPVFTNVPNLNQVPENLNDGDLNSIAQIQYNGEYGENVLKDSFYLILDLGTVHDLEALLVKWYPVSKRCVKYIVSVSEDGVNYTEALDYSDNLTQYDSITDDLTGLSGRYVRFEILGNYRKSDQSRNGFFVISEIEVYGSEKDIPNPSTFDPYVGYLLMFILVVTGFFTLKKCRYTLH